MAKPSGQTSTGRKTPARTMRPSTWLFWLTLGALLVKYPNLASTFDELLAVVVWLALQPPILVAILAAVVVHRVRGWAT